MLLDLARWAQLSVYSLVRTGGVDQRLALAVQRDGRFDRPLEVAGWALLERAGNRLFHWGSKIEVIGRLGAMVS